MAPTTGLAPAKAPDSIHRTAIRAKAPISYDATGLP